MKFAPALLLLTSVPWSHFALANVACEPSAQAASVDLTLDQSGRVYVPVQIAHHSENMLLQTGLFISAVSTSAAAELGLQQKDLPVREFMFTSGSRVHQYANVDQLAFNTLNTGEARLIIIPDARLTPDEAGVVGADILRNYDIELDFANSKFRLYPPGRCGSSGTYDPSHELPIDVTGRGQITTELMLDGKPVKALLDTGMPRSVMSLSTAQHLFGWNDKFAGLKPIGERSHSYTYVFKSIEFDSVSIPDPEIVIQSDVEEWPDLVLGMNILRQLHLYIDYRSEKLVVAPAEQANGN